MKKEELSCSRPIAHEPKYTALKSVEGRFDEYVFKFREHVFVAPQEFLNYVLESIFKVMRIYQNHFLP